VLLFGIVVVLFKVTEFKDRWLQPLFVATPILLVVLARDALNRARLKILILLAAAISCIVVVAAPGRLYLTEWRGRRDILNAPFREFASELKQHVQDADFIVTGTYWVGGNLQLWFPDKPIFCPEWGLAPPDINFPGQKCLIVWNAERGEKTPLALAEFARSFSGNEEPAATFIEENWKYHQHKVMRLGVMFLNRNGVGRSPSQQ
jgi:hypothetical protein